MMNDLDFDLFLAVWNRFQNQETPRVHIRIANWLQQSWERGETHLLLMAFRACGKSTLVGLFCAWVLLRDPDKRILVLSADLNLARKMVRQVRRIVERHPLTGPIRPEKMEEWASERFTVRRELALRDPSMLASGIAGNITGARADLLICDDVEVPRTSETAEKRALLRRRLDEAEYVLTPRGVRLYVGTPHHEHSIYARKPCRAEGEDVPFLDGYRRLEIPILSAQGKSAWPERYPLPTIEEMKRRSGPHKFLSQMMLKPANMAQARLNPELLKDYEAELEYSESRGRVRLHLNGREMAGCSAWWDPSFAGPHGDSSVVAVIFTDAGGHSYIHDVAYLRIDPSSYSDEAAQQCAQVTALMKRYCVPSIAIEVNGLGRFLPNILRNHLGEAGWPCAVVEITSRRPKEMRILEAFDAPLAARALSAHARVWDTRFPAEMRDWRPGLSGARDDGLDAVAGALSRQPVRLNRHYAAPRDRPPLYAGGREHRAKTQFEI